ncbi:preprotein translocase subunit SecA, partial [Patescibacteria group bacterium]|nr:preprotein translocase subunit SecA [Patescibacteria group bacterium]
MSKFLNVIFGDPNKKALVDLQKVVDQINALEPDIQKLTDAQLKAKTQEFKDRLAQGEALDHLMPEAYAVVREAAKRTLGQRHYDVQLMGGIVMHRGSIAEMRTGEGKTLTATLPMYLNALTGQGAHLVTVNDYLARRDLVWMGQIYHFLGLSCATIQHLASFVYDPDYVLGEGSKAEAKADEVRDAVGDVQVEMEYLRPVTRAEAYAADITYGTNNEFGFDYLRDNMAPTFDQMVQKALHFAIVDEVDSILIDEARTPLIISAPAEKSNELYYRFADIIKTLNENEDFNIDEKMRAATLTEEGITKIEKAMGIDNLYAVGNNNLQYFADNALRARALYKRDVQYVVKEDEVIIVDEFTGRLMPGRRFGEGQHQAIEAKEGVAIQRESQTLATITFQNYFRMYEKLSGMTGTAVTEAEEFGKIYNLDVMVIPTNVPPNRTDLPDRVYKSELGKFTAVVKEIQTLHEKGQPILLGTASIEKNELLATLLEQAGLPFNMLNAKNHAKEAEYIAQAGRVGAVTLATNMAGRGVDIKLGGNPVDPKEEAKVKALGGLHVGAIIGIITTHALAMVDAASHVRSAGCFLVAPARSTLAMF